MVHIIYFCMHNLQLIGILAPTQNSEAMGPGSHNLKWKINFFSRFFKNELILSQNHLILHCNFFRALFVSLINFTGLFPPGVHCAPAHVYWRVVYTMNLVGIVLNTIHNVQYTTSAMPIAYIQGFCISIIEVSKRLENYAAHISHAISVKWASQSIRPSKS